MGSLPDDFKNSHEAAILPVIERRRKKKSAIFISIRNAYTRQSRK